MLTQAGHEVYGVPRKASAYFRGQINIPSKYRRLPIANHLFGAAGDFYIVAETAPSKKVDSARKRGIKIVWWQLAPYRFLGGDSLPKAGDFCLPYSSYVDPDAPFYYYYQPPLDSVWSEGLSEVSGTSKIDRLRLCIYNGKGRIVRLPQSILAMCAHADVVVVTRQSPSTRDELFKLLRSCHGLISFDEFSALNLEAASMGVPVFVANPLFPSACRKRFSVPQLQQLIAEVPSEFQKAVDLRSRNGFSPWVEKDLVAANQLTLQGWLSLLACPDSFHHLKVTRSKLQDYEAYTQFLRSKRVISVDNGGQAGGVLLFPLFSAWASRGECPFWLLLAIALLDHLYATLGFVIVKLSAVATRINRKLNRGALETPCYSYRRGLRSRLRVHSLESGS